MWARFSEACKSTDDQVESREDVAESKASEREVSLVRAVGGQVGQVGASLEAAWRRVFLPAMRSFAVSHHHVSLRPPSLRERLSLALPVIRFIASVSDTSLHKNHSIFPKTDRHAPAWYDRLIV